MLSTTVLFLLYILVFTLAMKQAFHPNSQSYIYNWGGSLNNGDYLIIAIALIIACSFKGTWLPDTQPYIDAFYNDDSRMELMWSFFRRITLWTKTPSAIFFIYSFISIFFTLRFLKTYCRTPLMSLLIWMSYIFIIQDMIQIRQGVSSAIFLNTIPYIQNRDWKKYFGFNIFGCLFHISALAVLPIYFLDSKRIQRNLFLWMIPIAYFLFFAELGLVFLIQYIQIDFIQALWVTKSTMLYVTEEVNLFNIRQIILVSINIILWLNIKKIYSYYPSSLLYIKIFTIAIVTFIILFDVPDIASRLNIIYSISEIVAIPALLYIPKNRIYGRLIVLSISLLFFITYFYRFVLP